MERPAKALREVHNPGDFNDQAPTLGAHVNVVEKKCGPPLNRGYIAATPTAGRHGRQQTAGLVIQHAVDTGRPPMALKSAKRVREQECAGRAWS